MKGRNCITWMTSLSLDAPLVVVVWQNAISVHHSLNLTIYQRLLVFAAVWLGYTADRWIDAWKHEVNLSQRHSFHALSRWSLFVLWILVLAVALAVSFKELTDIDLKNGLLLALASLFVTGIVQVGRLGRFRATMKSAFTAILVALSVLVFTHPEPIDTTLTTLLLMAPLFFLNCLLIHSWDREIDAKQNPNETSQSTRTTIILTGILVLGIAFYFVSTYPLSWYVISSALILIAIHFCFYSLHIETRRTLADIALLTPIFTFI